MAKAITLVSLNIRGICNDNKKLALKEWISKKKIDICLLQETYLQEEKVVKFRKEWDGEVYFSATNSCHSRGVCTILSESITKHDSFHFISYHTDKEGRRLIVNFEFNQNIYSVVNLYCPNTVSQRDIFFNEAVECMNVHCISDINCIIGGDFNSVTSAIDKSTSIKIGKSEKIPKGFIDSLDVKDVWRLKNPNEKQFTYIDPSDRGYNSRIDLFLVKDIILKDVIESSIIQAPSPDHKAVKIKISLSKRKRGKGYWKMN